MSTDFSSIILWYVFIVLLGWSSIPLVFVLFPHFADRGCSLAKTLGLLLTTYLIWLTSSIGLTHYFRHTLLSLLVLYVLLNLVLFFFRLRDILHAIKIHIRLFLLIEGIFLALFLVCVIIRMYNPDISGAEKEADFTLLNAILQSKSFPPKDTWFAGQSINYYYFGYVIWASVIKATGIIPPVGFNLALATIAGLSAIGIFGLVYHFTRRISYGLFSSGLLMVFGNLDGFIQIIQRQGRLLPFDWWRSSRVIPDTINEFPYFSFLLGDLHAHFMAIPFTLFLFALLAQFVETAGHSVSKRYLLVLLLFIGLSLGGSAAINGWDYPTYLIITGLCLLIALRDPRWLNDGLMERILVGLVILIWLVVLSRLLFWPFYQNFTPQLTVKNLRLVSSSQRTGIRYFGVIYGLFLWALLPWIYDKLASMFPLKPSRNALLVWGNGILLAIALFYLCVSERVFLLASCLALMLLYGLYQEWQRSSTSSFPFLLLFMACAVIAGCEILYIKDFYSHPLERQNTIFKFYYQAWILLSIGIPYVLYHVARKQRRIHRGFALCWKTLFILLCSVCFVYPVLATYQKSNYFRGRGQGGLLYVPTLNGIAYIAYREPYEYEALVWIQNNLDSGTVILEATGPPFSFFGRVATTTGRSTVLGWGNHESLWRDQSWRSITQRTEDIKSMYESADKTRIRVLLQKYQIEYIYVGALERETYNAEGLEAFKSYFPVVYENELVKIYETAIRSADY